MKPLLEIETSSLMLINSNIRLKEKTMKKMYTFKVVTVSFVMLIALSNRAIAGNEFAAGSAQISTPCKFQFDARSNGGHATEQCNFDTTQPGHSDQVLFAGPVLCFKAADNIATFVWQFQKADGLSYYQQVYIVDNGAPGQGVPDQFKNDPEDTALGSLCDNLSLNNFPGTSPVLKGNYVVSTEE